MASVSYAGNGTQTDFNFSFLYLNKSHIKVYVDDVDTSYTWVSAGTVRVSPAPAGGTTVKIARETPSTFLVSWPEGVVILGADLNKSRAQAQYIAEEARDIALNSDAAVFAAAAEESADEAADSATAAAASATAAAASAANAASSVVAAATSFDNFDDRFLGNKSSDPSVDNDGNALVVGTMYFNTVINKVKIWTGSAWGLAFNDTAAASAITNDSGVSGATVAAALNTLNTGLGTKQATLVSGTNIKTVGGSSLLGSGDVSVSAFPSGTRLLFHQTAAPTGWTKETNASYNNKALRLVTGTVSSGGSNNFDTALVNSLTSGATTLTTSQIPSHSHGSNIVKLSGSGIGIPDASTYSGSFGTTDTAGTGGSHTHTVQLNVAYHDVIIATKD
jgi:hypothetical protein